MRKIRILILLIAAVMFYAVIAFAQGPEDKEGPVASEQMKEKPRGQEYMPGMAMQMSGAMPKQMIATSDGGVIILAGNKLLKYDKDLNLVREVELKTEPELKMGVGPMQGMMKTMQEKYGRKSRTEGQ